MLAAVGLQRGVQARAGAGQEALHVVLILAEIDGPAGSEFQGGRVAVDPPFTGDVVEFAAGHLGVRL